MGVGTRGEGVTVDALDVLAYEIPTDQPESDGTLQWTSTTIVVVLVEAAGRRGLGYTYSDAAAARLIEDKLAGVVSGADALSVPASWWRMHREVRNLGHSALTMQALAAVDIALWDLKATLLEVPLAVLLGRWRDSVPVYGSGGFTSYSVERLQEQLAGWVEMGIPRVKMKVGREPQRDGSRVAAARKAIGDDAALFVDANGAYDRKEALDKAYEFSEQGVSWFEEPVTSDDLAGLKMLRDRSPRGMEIAAGEYGYDLEYFKNMLEADAVDVIQPDVTRCGGITGFLGVGPLCDVFKVPLSAHTAPQLDAHVCTSVKPLRHVEYFHDHVRIEDLLFDGVLRPEEGALHPDLSRPGLGLTLKPSDAERYLVYKSDRSRGRT